MRFFSQQIYWLVQIFWWLFTTFILRYPTTKYFENPPIRISYLIISFLIGIILTHCYTVLYEKKARKSQLSLMYAVAGTIVTGLSFYLLDYYFGFQRYRKPSQGLPLELYDYFQFFIESIRYVVLWFLFYHLLVINTVSKNKAIALAQSETALKTAELANLKNQLNPHFLFNAINSIKALTISDPSMARDALTQLSELLRTSLTIGNEHLVSLDTEISFVNDYLFLEKIRYENRLNYFFNIEKSALTFKIPPMSLQLLVENAIKHGISKHKTGGDIFINATYKNNIFCLSVINSGKLLPNVSPTGVGLKNLEKRLYLNFRENADFTIKENINQVVSLITISAV
ncbi:histidine kinase [Arcicella aurantiaca]|uniref:Histidine kinase n=1 Tax=Arcicella aurantiaca TaxID=591202 RepID=A0A316E7D7_9BACT|nr:histidine kinase [Arcicella aurantiaca]PWK18870.1 histidine kinase [Arcicella aurantiaca]